ncbi:acyl carrier protein [Terrisporobacter petrolearius]|uniref:acyl carrier protein n=1 Tax=Terrisporobacter petrolearius TaxID=1460447 RepID=UPI003AFFF2B3
MFEKIRDIIVEQLGLDDKDGLSMETSFKEDLDADSLDAVEVIMGLEEEFDIEIPDEDAENFKTIGDVVEYIENR